MTGVFSALARTKSISDGARCAAGRGGPGRAHVGGETVATEGVGDND